MQPFRIKMVEPIALTSRAQRIEKLAAARHNLFRLRAEDVMVDLLTDSGTGAMSQAQWAAMMQGDESYAGAASFYRFERAVREVTGYAEVIPTHQGRAAEALLFGALEVGRRVVPNNTHFDTTRANILRVGGLPVDLPSPASAVPHSHDPFKGDMDTERLELLLHDADGLIPCVLVTITNNAAGGQPVSLDNLRAVRRLTRARGIPLFLDACRFAENAWLARNRTPELRGRTLAEVAHAYFELADGCLMSAKKNGLVNIGGFVALNDPVLAARIREAMVVTEGFPTYGGLAGRDLEAIAVGLHEALDEDYMGWRVGEVAWLADTLTAAGVPIVQPAGGHAVFVDAGGLLPRIPREAFPGQALACALYLEGGVRACEIGTLMFGADARHELVRLALPHRVYTRSHLEHVVETFGAVTAQRRQLQGYRIVEAPPLLRHFTAVLEPLTADQPEASQAPKAVSGVLSTA